MNESRNLVGAAEPQVVGLKHEVAEKDSGYLNRKVNVKSKMSKKSSGSTSPIIEKESQKVSHLKSEKTSERPKSAGRVVSNEKQQADNNSNVLLANLDIVEDSPDKKNSERICKKDFIRPAKKISAEINYAEEAKRLVEETERDMEKKIALEIDSQEKFEKKQKAILDKLEAKALENKEKVEAVQMEKDRLHDKKIEKKLLRESKEVIMREEVIARKNFESAKKYSEMTIKLQEREAAYAQAAKDESEKLHVQHHSGYVKEEVWICCKKKFNAQNFDDKLKSWSDGCKVDVIEKEKILLRVKVAAEKEKLRVQHHSGYVNEEVWICCKKKFNVQKFDDKLKSWSDGCKVEVSPRHHPGKFIASLKTLSSHMCAVSVSLEWDCCHSTYRSSPGCQPGINLNCAEAAQSAEVSNPFLLINAEVAAEQIKINGYKKLRKLQEEFKKRARKTERKKRTEEMIKSKIEEELILKWEEQQEDRINRLMECTHSKSSKRQVASNENKGFHHPGPFIVEDGEHGVERMVGGSTNTLYYLLSLTTIRRCVIFRN